MLRRWELSIPRGLEMLPSVRGCFVVGGVAEPGHNDGATSRATFSFLSLRWAVP